MYDRLVQEGHDARLLRFSPNGDIPGSHQDPKNSQYWKIGCLGITEGKNKNVLYNPFQFFHYFCKTNISLEEKLVKIRDSKQYSSIITFLYVSSLLLRM